jgi:hypothetical protein
MGCVQLGTAACLATAASQHAVATELRPAGLLEPILGPIWVWVLTGENRGLATLSAARSCLAAVLANEASRHARAWRAPHAPAPDGFPANGQARLRYDAPSKAPIAA